MRLVDLDPRWLVKDGKRVGFIFRSPTDPKWYQSAFVRPTPPRREQWALFREALQISLDDYVNVQGCKQEAGWDISPDIATATFDQISVTPSLDGSPGGLWHGFITAGQIVGGI